MNNTCEIKAICISEQRGTQKKRIPSCFVKSGWGIEGDAHGGFPGRQLSCLAEESIARMRAKLPDLKDGAFGENFVTFGIDWLKLSIGARMIFGDNVVVQITQKGKICHSPCEIFAAVGECIMPTEGVFLIPRTSGALKIGDSIRIDPNLDRIRFAVITASDRSAAGEREDRSGIVISEIIERELKAFRAAYEIVPDERDRISQTLKGLCDESVIDVIFTTGGTGLSPRDVTPEATCAVIDRQIPGMAEAMRAAGLAHTPHAMLSRAVCGQRGYTLIINLSGSPKAVVEQLEAVLPALPHAISVACGLPQDCARK